VIALRYPVPGVDLGGTAPTDASRSASGSSVSFLFGDDRVTPSDGSFFHIKTNATAFDAFG
jgi:hypothetical protein